MANNFYAKGEEYEIPSTSNYMKFDDGDNKFRILGAFSEGTAIQGIEYWKTINNKRTPIRLKKNKDGTFPNVPNSELEVNKFGNLDTPKFFWAFPVWNYSEKKIQILEITQVTILRYIKKVIENPKWGDPRDYDLIVTSAKNGDKTEYTVTNDPKEKLAKEIIDLFIGTPINLEALFDGADPFAVSGSDLADAAEKAGI